MRALVTGSQGFVGRHLIRELLQHNWAIGAFDVTPPEQPDPQISFFQGDIQDSRATDSAIKQFQPEACLHLSGIAFVPEAWANTQALFAINVIGTINLLEACRRFAPSARILVVSSAEVYGEQAGQGSVTESNEFAPANPYAASKAAADYITRIYARQYSLPAMVVRPSNHIGPGQSPSFAVASFAAQLAAACATNKPVAIKVGNLDCARNFTDVRDVARAYRLLIEKGRPGEAYNVASDREVTLRYVLEQLCQIAGISPAIEIDPSRFRPGDARPRLATTKIQSEINWKPEIAIETTLRDIFQEVRQHAGKT